MFATFSNHYFATGNLNSESILLSPLISSDINLKLLDNITSAKAFIIIAQSDGINLRSLYILLFYCMAEHVTPAATISIYVQNRHSYNSLNHNLHNHGLSNHNRLNHELQTIKC